MSERASLRSGGVKAGEVFLTQMKSFTCRSCESPASFRRTWDEHASYYIIEVECGLGYTTVTDSVHFDSEKLFGRRSPLIIEIGSGTGEQIIEAVRTHPDRDYLAFEVWVSDITRLISKAVGAGVENIRVVEADAQLALSIILDEAITQEVWTFSSNPWRKAHHYKRHLVPVDFAPEVARVLEDGGLWRLATDWDDYAWRMRGVIEGCEFFENPYEGERPDPNDPEPSRGGSTPRFSGRVETHFETWGIDAGWRVYSFAVMRLPRKGASPGDE